MRGRNTNQVGGGKTERAGCRHIALGHVEEKFYVDVSNLDYRNLERMNWNISKKLSCKQLFCMLERSSIFHDSNFPYTL